MSRRTCDVCEAETDSFICKGCCLELERAIGDMTSLIHETSVLATMQTRVYRSSNICGPDEELAEIEEEYGHRMARIPAWLRPRDGRIALPRTATMVNLDAREALENAGNTLSGWTRHIAETRGVDLPTTDGMVAWLLTNVESIRWDECAAMIHEELTWLHGDLERRVDRSPSRLFAGPCHAPHYDEDEDGSVHMWRCERDLYSVPGKWETVCDGYRVTPGDKGCRTVHTLEDRRVWLLAGVEDSLLPLDLLVAALSDWMPGMTPPKSIWRVWRHRGLLQARGIDRMGVELYRGGDVVRMVEDYSRRATRTA